MSGEKNNFGCLRLLLACMVIVGHEPEFIDGNRHHELLTQLFHTLSLGEVAVDFFFVISGYLITKSALNAASYSQYLSNRARRILPGYAVAYLLCVIVLAPALGGAPLNLLPKVIGKFVLISPPPYVPGILMSIRYNDLNDSLWTIGYEFRCYLIVLALLAAGVLQRRRVMLIATAALLAASVAVFCTGAFSGVSKAFAALFGEPLHMLEFGSTFFVGACFYLYWPELKDRLTARVAMASVAVLAALMFVHPIANTAVAVFGGLALFWLALKADLGPLQRINDRWDISYGVYLYGWPAGVTILYFNRHASAWVLTPITLLVAMALGAISWFVVENPMRRAKVSAPSVSLEIRRVA